MANLLGTKIRAFCGVEPTITEGTINVKGLTFTVSNVDWNKKSKTYQYLLSHAGAPIDAYAMYNLIKSA
jgi:hypothetical protein